MVSSRLPLHAAPDCDRLWLALRKAGPAAREEKELRRNDTVSKVSNQPMKSRLSLDGWILKQFNSIAAALVELVAGDTGGHQIIPPLLPLWLL